MALDPRDGMAAGFFVKRFDLVRESSIKISQAGIPSGGGQGLYIRNFGT